MSQIIECESALFYQRAVWIWELMGVEMCFVSSFHLVKNLQGLTSPPPHGYFGDSKNDKILSKQRFRFEHAHAKFCT